MLKLPARNLNLEKKFLKIKAESKLKGAYFCFRFRKNT